MNKNNIKDLDVESDRLFEFKKILKKISGLLVKVVVFASIIAVIAIIINKATKDSKSSNYGWEIEMHNSLGQWEKMIDVYGYCDSYGIDLDYWYAIKIAESLHKKHNKAYRVVPLNKETYLPVQTFDGRPPMTNEEKLGKLKNAIFLISRSRMTLENSKDYGSWRSFPIINKIKMIGNDYFKYEEDLKISTNLVSEVIFEPNENDYPEDNSLEIMLNCYWVNSSFGERKSYIIKTISEFQSKIGRIIPDTEKTH